MNRGGKADVSFPIAQLQKILMFEDEDDTTSFLSYCGVEVCVCFKPLECAMMFMISCG